MINHKFKFSFMFSKRSVIVIIIVTDGNAWGVCIPSTLYCSFCKSMRRDSLSPCRTFSISFWLPVKMILRRIQIQYSSKMNVPEHWRLFCFIVYPWNTDNRRNNICIGEDVTFVLRLRNNYLFYSYLFSFNWLIEIPYYNLLDVFVSLFKKNWAIFERILLVHEYSEILESLHNQISLRYLFLMQVFQESGYFQFYICYWQSYETINEKQSSVHFILFTWQTLW